MGTIPPQVGSRQSCSHTQHLSQFPIPAIGISPLWSRPEQEVVSHLPKRSSSLCHFSNGHDTLILLLQSCSCGTGPTEKCVGDFTVPTKCRRLEGLCLERLYMIHNNRTIL